MSTLTIPAAFIAALISVESGGNDHAIGDNDQAVGCLQIHPCVVEDVNHFLFVADSPYRYTLGDRAVRAYSVSMLRIYLSHVARPERLGREPSLEDLARIWNGGPNGHTKPATKPYWVKVRTAMEDCVSAETGNFYTSAMGFYCFTSPEGDFFANTL